MAALAALTAALSAAPDAEAGKKARKRIQSDEYEQQGRTLISQKRYQEAWQYESKAIELNPLNSPAYSDRGWTLIYLGKAKEAMADFEKAISLDPTNANAYEGRAGCHRRLGQEKEAAQDTAKAIQVQAGPRHDTLMQELAAASLNVSSHPEDDDAYWRRASKYYELGMFQQCINDCGTSLSRNPYNPHAFEWRGKAYQALGRMDQYANDNASYKKLTGKDINQPWAHPNVR